MAKIIENSNEYHLWTDVLHARALAHQANNKWDRAAYIRWTVIIGWISLEIACQDALEEKNISYSFRQNLDNAVENKNLPKIEWGKGIWQKVSKLQEIRKNYVHRFVSEKDLFPEADVADEAIKVIRDAVKKIYIHCGKTPPNWIEDDADRGWSNISPQGHAYRTVIRGGANDDPNRIKISFLDKSGEHDIVILPSNADCKSVVYEFIKDNKDPFSSIRIYKAEKLIEELFFNIRGN